MSAIAWGNSSAVRCCATAIRVSVTEPGRTGSVIRFVSLRELLGYKHEQPAHARTRLEAHYLEL